MKTDVQIGTTSRRAIELDGIHGTFRIKDCAFAIHYFSTYATPSSDEKEEHYRDLLEELKPMRERVSAKELTDLNALLQRDLSDERIATELVPYLCGKVSKVGLFPPVLAVLVPRGFIETKAAHASEYPIAETGESGLVYGKLWQLQYHAGSKRLGRLSIFAGTEIIVLDGQHRSNAFRYVSDVLKPSELYSVFYEHAQKPAAFDSDLPVTIAWFEAVSTQKVQPNDISRELFVAVNNTAKRVSESRTILLDDTDPVCLAVNTYYSNLAKKRGFKTGGMNLLCACFDVDVDEAMSNYRPVFALTDALALKSATTYAFFGLDRYDLLERSKANRMPQTNKSRFERLFGTVGYIDTGGGRRIQPIIDVANRADFRARVVKHYVPLLDALFEKSALAICHHAAVKQIEDWINGPEGGVTYVDTWEKVFCGGEGLFGQIQQSESDKATKYQKAIRGIQEQFRLLRRAVVREKVGKAMKLADGRIEKAYELFDTIACQTGIVMALSVVSKELHRKRVAPPARTKKMAELIEDIKVSDWLRFFTVFERLYFGNLDANAWPRFQKLFIRLFYKEIKVFEIHVEWSPECEMVVNRAAEIVTGLAEGGKNLKEADGEEAVATALKEVKAAFAEMGEKVSKAAIEKCARRAMKNLLGKLERRRQDAMSNIQVAVLPEEADDENGDQI